MDSNVSLNIIKNWPSLCNDIVFTDIAPSLLQNEIITVNEYQNISSQLESAKIESLLLLLLKKNDKVLVKFADSLEKDYSWLAEKIKGCSEKIKEEGRDEIDATPITQMDSCKSFENDTTTEDEKDMCIDCNNLNSISRNSLNNRIKIKTKKLESRRLKSRVKNRLRPKIQNSDADVTSTTELVKPVLNDKVTDEVIKIMRNSSLLSKSWTTIAHSMGLTDKVHEIRFKTVLYDEDVSMCVVYLMRNWLEMSPKEATLTKLIEILRHENFNRVADQLTEILYGKPVTADHSIR